MSVLTSRFMSERASITKYSDLLSFCVLISGAICLLIAFVFSFHFFTATPFADTWSVIDEIVINHGGPSVWLLWAQHNEHRIVIPKLLMWADLFWMGDKGWSLFVEIYLAQFLEALLAAYAVRRLGGWKWVETRTVFGVALFCAFCPIQYEIFVWSFGLPIVLCYASIQLALISLVFYSQGQKRFWLILSFVAAIAAPLNLAGGQLVWPALLLVGWNLRLKMRMLFAILFGAVLSMASYLIGYVSPPNHANLLDSLRKPAEVAHYVLLYFAGSWQALGRPLGYVLATASIVLVIGWNCRAVMRRNESPLRVVFLALAGSLIGSAFLTALGRLTFGLEQAVTSRYQTSALLFWCCIFVLCTDLLLRNYPRMIPVLASMVFVAMLVALPAVKVPWREATLWAERMSIGTIPLVANVQDDDEISNLVGSAPRIFRDTDLMRAHGWATYNTFEYRRMGVMLTSIYQVLPAERCAGNFDRFEYVGGSEWPGYRAFGWAWDRVLGKTLEKIVIASETGEIIGLALNSGVRPDVKALVPGVTSSFTGWKGYVSSTLAWREGRAFGELPGGREVCALSGMPPRPDATPIALH